MVPGEVSKPVFCLRGRRDTTAPQANLRPYFHIGSLYKDLLYQRNKASWHLKDLTYYVKTWSSASEENHKSYPRETLTNYFSSIQVKAVHYQPGDKVAEGDIMVEIEHHPDQ